MRTFDPFTAVVLVDKNMGIGIGNDMLIHCRSFRERQLQFMKNHPVIMGRQAYDAFQWSEAPEALAQRILLFSTTADDNGSAEVIRSVKQLLSVAPKRAIVMGGEETYRTLLPYCDSIIACQVDIDLPADKKFPVRLGKDKRWRVCERSKVLQGRHALDIPFQYVTYRRDSRIEPLHGAAIC